MKTLPISDTGVAIRVMTLAAVAVESGRYNVAQYTRIAELARYRFWRKTLKRLDKRLMTDVLNGVIRAKL